MPDKKDYQIWCQLITCPAWNIVYRSYNECVLLAEWLGLVEWSVECECPILLRFFNATYRLLHELKYVFKLDTKYIEQEALQQIKNYIEEHLDEVVSSHTRRISCDDI